MHSYDPRLAELLFAYMRKRLTLDPVPLDQPVGEDALHGQLAGLIGAHGHDPAEVLRVYDEHLSRAVISCDSPRYLSLMPAAPTKAAVMFDMVVSSASVQGASWLEASGAVAAENQVLALLARLAGLPREAGGCFVSGGTAANLSALAVARETARERRDRPTTGAPMRVAVGHQAHSSIMSALRLLDLDPLLVTEEDHRLTGPALRAALDAAERDTGTVIAVVASAGTTNAGIVDDLTGVGRIAQEHGMWFHVDGAYGAAALLAPSVRRRLAGIERADSLVVDPHKWLMAPYDCAALLYRSPELARAVHAQDAEYLDIFHAHDTVRWNPSDYAHHLSRRARGLPLWFSLAVHGTDAYARAVEAGIRLARHTADLIHQHPRLELLREPELSVVLFRRRGWSADDYRKWCADLLARQIAFVCPTRWEGQAAARLVFLHPDTTTGIVKEVLDTL
ncbi:pyridoxal phosphate-dependent decarboxylase family protein [Streptomyces huasconensis]|uniref:pyridoxal phosphate-dependent decarboxylase family protein n=1 Tax=Streptomyces huasconensis TaxID=1854574 RepID=UPI0034048F1C